MYPAIILFAATYVLMLTFSKYRPYIALASAALFLVSGMLPLNQVFSSIDWNVLMMIAGTSRQRAAIMPGNRPAANSAGTVAAGTITL